MYQIFRLGCAETTVAADEAGPETADTDSTAEAGTTADGPEGGKSTGVAAIGVDPLGVATLIEELLLESISRFSRFKSPRSSDATW
jgi:hypothetical protein